MRAVGVAAVLSVLLVGCSSNESPQAATTPSSTPIPSTVGGTVPVPTNTLSTAKPTDAAVPPELPEEATAPPPATAGPLNARNLPAPDKLGAGWKTYVDPGGAEEGFLGNQTWTRRREPHQAAYEALPLGCAGQLPSGSLPVPQYALQGAYRTADAKPGTALLLRFADADKASAYRTGYQARMAACGEGGDLSVKQLWTEDTAAAAVRRYAGDESEQYVDVSVVHGSTVALLAAASAQPDTQSDWAHSVVRALEAVIDSP
ncbi:hypothetical protein EV652_107232 [Kribbella steppae]|uniref:PknH-like protein n=1 Tax=Kribbella steppae TaxID=2512223 RepID=A0A4R2HDB9_9ACTN|nr:hypothetical protein EV652_107232 [Kribbella steppae]